MQISITLNQSHYGQTFFAQNGTMFTVTQSFMYWCSGSTVHRSTARAGDSSATQVPPLIFRLSADSFIHYIEHMSVDGDSGVSRWVTKTAMIVRPWRVSMGVSEAGVSTLTVFSLNKASLFFYVKLLFNIICFNVFYVY